MLVIIGVWGFKHSKKFMGLFQFRQDLRNLSERNNPFVICASAKILLRFREKWGNLADGCGIMGEKSGEFGVNKG